MSIHSPERRNAAAPVEVCSELSSEPILESVARRQRHQRLSDSEHIVTQHPENRVLFTNESGLTVMMRFVVLLCAEERRAPPARRADLRYRARSGRSARKMACLPCCRELSNGPRSLPELLMSGFCKPQMKTTRPFCGSFIDASVKEIAPLPLDVTGTVLLAYRELWLELEHCPDRKRLNSNGAEARRQNFRKSQWSGTLDEIRELHLL